MPPASDKTHDTDAKYVLIYAKDLKIPRGDPANSEMVTFRSLAGYLWFLARNKQARAAARAGRTQFVTIDRKKK